MHKEQRLLQEIVGIVLEMEGVEIGDCLAKAPKVEDVSLT
jgi:hypothetical protein